MDSWQDAKREVSPRLYDFAAAVGVRRAEYTRLRGDNLVCGESGYLCVRIQRGKDRVQYDRLAVLATSVFHLSHWRCGVTINNYLLAY